MTSKLALTLPAAVGIPALELYAEDTVVTLRRDDRSMTLSLDELRYLVTTHGPAVIAWAAKEATR